MMAYGIPPPSLGEAMREESLEEVQEYIMWSQNTVAQYIATRADSGPMWRVDAAAR